MATWRMTRVTTRTWTSCAVIRHPDSNMGQASNNQTITVQSRAVRFGSRISALCRRGREMPRIVQKNEMKWSVQRRQANDSQADLSPRPVQRWRIEYPNAIYLSIYLFIRSRIQTARRSTPADPTPPAPLGTVPQAQWRADKKMKACAKFDNGF